LSKQKRINQQLTTDLEVKVSKRTHELHAALRKLNNSEKIAKIGNFQYWINTDVWEASENITEILGIKSEELTNMKSFLNIVRQETREKVDISLQSACKQKKRIQIDFTISERYRRGYQWATLIGECHELPGHGACFSGTIQDISERKKAEAEVHKLSLVARLINSGVILTDIEKKIIWANEGMQKLTGYTVTEMIGKTPRLFQSEKTDAETLARINQQLKLQQSIKVELQNIRKDGICYWIELNIQPFWDEYENLSGYLAIQVDITERKRYEEELKKSLLRETDLNQMKSQFLSMASHELRTPLTSIQSSAELLAIQLESSTLSIDSEKSKRHTNRIINEVSRLTSFMNDTLVLSKTEAGKVSFQPVMCDVPAMINEILEGKEILQKDNRKIDIDYSGHPRLVHLDPLLFSHIVTNLASNALKYSKGKDAPKIEIVFHEKTIVIHFIDFGIGIPQEDQKKLFQSFFRASNAESIQGSGLGLMIVKQFVELHQGQLHVKSEVNVGTTITVELQYDNQPAV
jgi:PAS domain S-box-containing protein